MENSSTTLSTRKKSKRVLMFGIINLVLSFGPVNIFSISLLGHFEFMVIAIIAFSYFLGAILLLWGREIGRKLTIISCVPFFVIYALAVITFRRYHYPDGYLVLSIIEKKQYWVSTVKSTLFVWLPFIIYGTALLKYLTNPKVREQFK